jgi:hypothetical protein
MRWRATATIAAWALGPALVLTAVLAVVNAIAGTGTSGAPAALRPAPYTESRQTRMPDPHDARPGAGVGGHGQERHSPRVSGTSPPS